MSVLAPTRAAGLERLTAFVPDAGRHYANRRNHDTGPGGDGSDPGARHNVSVLSPYIRHRLVTEQEVVAAVLARHSSSAAEKFIQEVCWRTYWKGWLEMRPHVWQHYLEDLRRHRNAVARDGDLAQRLATAEAGCTGIACFDAWSRELVETGYLHNHTRMWFASIWSHTLELPWQLGADFFMRHLLDGDPASNTLSWRWVVGLQTAGKTYLARADNIEAYTGGRFAPHGELARDAMALEDSFDVGKPVKPMPAHPLPGGKIMLLLSEDDLTPEDWPVPHDRVVAISGLRTADAYPGTAANVVGFKQGALADAIARSQARFQKPVLVLPAAHAGVAAGLVAHAASAGADAIVTMGCPVGPTADAVRPVLGAIRQEGWTVAELRRPWDDQFWPLATAGFFKLKDKIPAVLERLEVDRQPQLPLR
ncbi:MAG: deoxyribodipyrimidine photolyase [Hyphomicrobiaceae bacterium]|nr:deoxyribodipyrimidine photolyase [Hyphomicrobiaceae bacterium]